MSKFVVPLHKQILVILLFPVMIVLAVVEPVWSEICRAFHNMDLYTGIKKNMHNIKDLYTKVLWEKKL